MMLGGDKLNLLGQLNFWILLRFSLGFLFGFFFRLPLRFLDFLFRSLLGWVGKFLLKAGVVFQVESEKLLNASLSHEWVILQGSFKGDQGREVFSFLVSNKVFEKLDQEGVEIFSFDFH